MAMVIQHPKKSPSHSCQRSGKTAVFQYLMIILGAITIALNSLWFHPNSQQGFGHEQLAQGGTHERVHPCGSISGKVTHISSRDDQHYKGQDIPLDEWILRLKHMLKWKNDGGKNDTRTRFPRLTSFRDLVKEEGKPDVNEESILMHQGAISSGSNVAKVHACLKVKKWAIMSCRKDVSTPAMKSILSNDQWCLVVIGSDNTPETFSNLNNERFIYFSVDDQLKLPFKIIQLTPKYALARKNIGYLYAMSQGAEVILDIDHDMQPIAINKEGQTLPVWNSHGIYQRPLLYKEEEMRTSAELPVWNPYPYFNLSKAWPRGYPWEYVSIHEYPWNSTATENQSCLPVIQQYLANNAPDFDAVYRMLNPGTSDYRTEAFRHLVAPRNVFAPYNAQATVHLKEAFWSMMLPITVDGRVADIWRSYITQSLFHFFPDACIMFTSPAVEHTRNPHNYTSEFSKEIPLYSQAASVIDLIRNLPMKVDNFEDAFFKVYNKLYETGVVEKSDPAYARAWMQDMKDLNIHLPKIPGNNTWMRNTQLCLMFNDATYAENVSAELVTKYLPLFDKIVLLLDQSTFPNLHQVLNKTGPLPHTELHYILHWPQEVSTYLCDSGKGIWQNRCLNKCLRTASEDNVQRAILYMGDDDFVNFTLAQSAMPKDKIWFPEITHLPGNPFNESLYTDYKNWTYVFHLDMAMKALEDLPTDLKSKYLSHVNATGLVEGHCLADCVYVPNSYHAKLETVIEEIEKRAPNMFSEAGMPLALNLVAPGDEKHTFDPDHTVWGSWRFRKPILHKFLEVAEHFHALKVSIPGPRAVWREVMALQYKLLANY